MRIAARFFLSMLLTLGLVLPRTSALVGAVAGAPAVLLCDGTDLLTLPLAPGDDPVEGAGHSPCPLALLVEPPPAPGPVPLVVAPVALERTVAVPRGLALRPPAVPEPRAPPSVA